MTAPTIYDDQAAHAFELLEESSMLNSCGAGDPVVSWFDANRTLLLAFVWLGLLVPLAWWGWGQYAPGSKGHA